MWFHIICLVITGTTIAQAQQNDTRRQFRISDANAIAWYTSATLKPAVLPGQQTPIAKRLTPEIPGGGNYFTEIPTNPQRDQLPVLRPQQQFIATNKLVQSKQDGSNFGIYEPGNTRLDQKPRFAGLPQFVNPQFSMWSLPLKKVWVRPLQGKNISKPFPDVLLPSRAKQASISNDLLSQLEQGGSKYSEPGNKPQNQLAAFLPRGVSPRAWNAALALMKIWNEKLRVSKMSPRLRSQRPPNQLKPIPTKPLIQAEQGGGNDSSEEPGGPVQEQVVTLPPKRTSFNPQLVMNSLYLNKMLTKLIPINAIPTSFRGAYQRVPQPSRISEPLLQSEQGVSNDSTEEPTNPQQEQAVKLPPPRTSFNQQLSMSFSQLNNMRARPMQARNRNVPFPFLDMLWHGKQPATPNVQQSQAEQGAGNDSTEEPGGTPQYPLPQLAESVGAAHPRAWSDASTAKKTWAEPFYFSDIPLSFRGEQRPVQEPSAVTDPLTQPEQGAGDSTEEPANTPQEKLPNLSLSDGGPVSANALKEALIRYNMLGRSSPTRTSSLFRRPSWPVQYRPTQTEQLIQKLFLDNISKNARSRNIQHPFHLAGISDSAMNPAMDSRLVQATKLYHLLNPQ